MTLYCVEWDIKPLLSHLMHYSKGKELWETKPQTLTAFLQHKQKWSRLLNETRIYFMTLTLILTP